MATLAPFSASRFAIAAPIPRDPPVTSATLPVSSLSVLWFIFRPLLCCSCGLSARFRKGCSKHRSFTFRLFFRHFVLEYKRLVFLFNRLTHFNSHVCAKCFS